VLLARGVLEIAQASGSTLDVARAYMSLGVSLTEDDQRASMRAFLDAAAAGAAAGSRLIEWQGLANASEAAADVGEWQTADDALSAIGDSTEADPVEIGCFLTQASLTAMRGDGAGGLQIMSGVAPVAQRIDSVQVQTWYQRALSLVQLAAGDPATALATARTSLDLEPSGANAPNSAWLAVRAACALRDADQIDVVLAQTSALRGTWFEVVRGTGRAAAAALHGQGEPGQATADLLACVSDFERLDLPLDHALAVIAVAWVLPSVGALGDHERRARATLERLGARGLLARLDEAVAHAS
jgi:ATP/maltotriose-dependent transcriptional regulator MalT